MICDLDPEEKKQAERAIARLQARKTAWLSVSTVERIESLKRCMQGVSKVAPHWAIAACEAKGIDPTASLAGEEWLTSAVATLLNLRCLVRSLEGRSVQISEANRALVFPDTMFDRLLWLGFRGEIWLEPNKPTTRGTLNQAGIALVLGAGNAASTPPMDVLHKLFAQNQVVLLKMNPVNAYVGTFLEQAFEPLIADGFLQIVYGGATLGSYLCQHSGIDTVHITGSHHTHNAIVWGTSAQPQLQKPITSELGCVTPVLVVPGNWSESDLAFQARHVASMVVHNASFNCVAAKVVITAKGWPLREAFLDRLRQEFASIPARKAYYPGAQQRYQAFLDAYPHAEIFGERTAEIVPWTFIPNVPADRNEYALQNEAFCGVLAEVSLEATTATEFIDRAIPFVNDHVWGNLSCMMLIDPKTQQQIDLDSAIAQLSYGAIGINVWTGVIYALPDLSWGAFPSNSLADIRSGRGVVHNACLFRYPQKSVLSAPFRIRPTPFWFACHRNLLDFAQQAAKLQITPTWFQFFRVIIAALKG